MAEGNRLLLDGKPTDALDAYQHADSLMPDAREIAFGMGLSHEALKDYQKARVAFEKASAFKTDPLGQDALYGVGASYHHEAIEQMEDDPQGAIGKLEEAMQRYQTVLSGSRHHPAAREAARKAAMLRRNIIIKLEEEQKKEDSEDPADEQKDGEPAPDQKKENDGEQDQEKENPQDKKDTDQEQDKEKQASDSDGKKEDQQEQQQQPSEAQKKEQASREQAERRLREMMQALRQRLKERREQAQPIRVAPVERDW